MKKDYVYYWYHHMMPNDDRKQIAETIDSKDYKTFIKFYKKYAKKAIDYGSYNEEFESWIPMTYLPIDVSVYINDKFSEYLSILDKEVFEKIIYQECECG